jgi:hypothetical protein
MISFIVPINIKRIDRLPGIEFNIKKFYFKDDYEIIVAEQDENEVFLPGQVRNLGFQQSKGDIIVFFDADARFKEYIDFKDILKNAKVEAHTCWQGVIEVNEDPKTFELTEITPLKSSSSRGFIFAVTRQYFLRYNGFSNLLKGWGKDDDINGIRSGSRKGNIITTEKREIVCGAVYHVWHKDRAKLCLDHNQKICLMVRNKEIEDSKDGVAQTISDLSLIEERECYKHFLISNIRVLEDFKYKNLFFNDNKNC